MCPALPWATCLTNLSHQSSAEPGRRFSSAKDPVTYCTLGAGTGSLGWERRKNDLSLLAVASHWNSLSPSQFVGKNREQQLINHLIVLWDHTVGNLCFPGTTHEPVGFKQNMLKEMTSPCKPKRIVWAFEIYLSCFLWY